jgi:ATP-dependent Clp protease ATP-binding subunit ClpC
MATVLKERIIDQDQAVERVIRVVKIARAGLREKDRPMGVFLFVGPSGVGRTEFALTLAEFLFGSEESLIRIDMSEFMERNSITNLIGSPPGYFGHEEEGQLIAGLRRRPYSVVLLDEIEKAHPEVCNLFLQVFDAGRITDSRGRTVSAKEAIFLMTSNLLAEMKNGGKMGFESPDMKKLELMNKGMLTNELKSFFRPEFLDRIDEIILFRSLDMHGLSRIANKMIAGLRDRAKKQGIHLKISQEAVRFICQKAYDPGKGARELARTIEREIGQPLSDLVIGKADHRGNRVDIRTKDGKILFHQS